MSTRSLVLGLTLALSSLLPACSSEHSVEWHILSNAAPSGIVLTEDRIEIPEGIVVWARAIPLEDDKRISKPVDMTPVNPIIGIDRASDADDDQAGTELVIFGVREGITSVDVYFGEERVDELQVAVVANAKGQ
jgi:hypothetical protein